LHAFLELVAASVGEHRPYSPRGILMAFVFFGTVFIAWEVIERCLRTTLRRLASRRVGTFFRWLIFVHVTCGMVWILGSRQL
jgi:hypothetical protein